MISEANVQTLMRCARNNENAPDFNLGAWFHPCGTYGCLVGNDVIATYPNGLRSLMSPRWTTIEYGIPHTISALLFSNRELSHERWGIECLREHGAIHPLVGIRRDPLNREAALNRLRKFIYYVLRKRELLYDDSGRIRETARRAEGDHFVIRNVLADVRSRRELQPA